MGQRLVINFYKNTKKIACIYRHWDAYTESALDTVDTIIDSLRDTKVEDGVDIAFMLHDLFGAWIASDDPELINNPKIRFTNFSFTNRNDGLIGISQEAMKNLSSGGEHFIDIDLSCRMVNFGVFYFYPSFAQFLYENTASVKDTKEYLRLITDVGYCPTSIPFEHFNQFRANILNGGHYLNFVPTDQFAIKVD